VLLAQKNTNDGLSTDADTAWSTPNGNTAGLLTAANAKGKLLSENLGLASPLVGKTMQNLIDDKATTA